MTIKKEPDDNIYCHQAPGYSAKIKELIAPHLNGMFVTPKDIDETVRRISYTISEALNMLFAASAT